MGTCEERVNDAGPGPLGCDIKVCTNILGGGRAPRARAVAVKPRGHGDIYPRILEKWNGNDFEHKECGHAAVGVPELREFSSADSIATTTVKECIDVHE